MRVVGVPDHAPRVPGEPQPRQEGSDIALRGRGRLPLLHERVLRSARRLRRREAHVHDGQRIHQQQRRNAAADGIHHIVHLVVGERRREHHQQAVEFFLDPGVRLDLDDLVLLSQFVHDRPFRRALHGLEVQPAEQPEFLGDHADAAFLGVRHHADAAGEFVLDRKAAVEEGDHLLFGGAGEGDAQEHFADPGAGRGNARDLARGDPEHLARFPRRFGEGRGVLDAHLHPAPAHRLHLPEDALQRGARLDQRLRHFGTQVGLHEHRPVVGEAAQQFAGLGGQGMEPFGGGVQPETEPGDQDDGTQQRERHRNRADGVVGGHPVAVGGGRPVPAADEQHIQVEEETGERQEVEDGSQRHRAAAELGEVPGGGDRLEEPGERRAEPLRPDAGEDDQRRTGCAQDERDRRDRSEQRRRHADGGERRAEQRVAQVVREQEPPVRTPEEDQHQRVAQRKRERRAVHAERRRVLAQDDLQVGGGEREEEFVGAEFSLLRPDGHRERRHEEQQDVREQPVQLVEVRQVVQEEPVLPERRRRAQQDEERQEHIPRRVREVHPQVAAHQRGDHAAAHLRDFDQAGHQAVSSPAAAGASVGAGAGSLPGEAAPFEAGWSPPPPVSR